MDASEFRRTIRTARSADERVAWFGALLGRAVGAEIEVVGGSAIEIYLTASAYTSEDIDIVGDRTAIASVLRAWGFREVEGRSRRHYWTDILVGLVDLVGLADRSGLPPQTIQTPHGPVRLSAPEPLIIRRLMRAERESSTALFDQAVALAKMGSLDWDYLESEARYEKVEGALARLKKAAGARRSSAGPR
ncbi:MAG: hypothetical protein L3J87_02370 [Thermoplasmata archaeon]|nr:hypothetical protein [Thermoplasmata archaeon]